MFQAAASRVRNRTKADNRSGDSLATASEVTSCWALAQCVGLTFSGSVRPAVDYHMNDALPSYTKWLKKTIDEYGEDGELPVKLNRCGDGVRERCDYESQCGLWVRC